MKVRGKIGENIELSTCSEEKFSTSSKASPNKKYEKLCEKELEKVYWKKEANQELDEVLDQRDYLLGLL